MTPSSTAPLYPDADSGQAESILLQLSPKEPSRVCLKCNLPKTIGEFYKDIGGRDGIDPQCKSCRKAYREELYSRTPTQVVDQYTTKICSKCGGDPQPLTNFSKSKRGRFALDSRCHSCVSKYRKQWEANSKEHLDEVKKKRHEQYIENRDYFRAIAFKNYWDDPQGANEKAKEWRINNPEKFQKRYLASRFKRCKTTQEWYERTLAEQGGVCAICRSPDAKGNGKGFQIDHNHNCCPPGKACDNCRRGLLCGICNHSLERLETVPDWGKKAMAYLNKYSKGKKFDVDQGSLFDS